MIDVRRLRVLREVALVGSVSGAARSLGYTPSAVSQQLATLERECGTELLRRRGRGVELTDEGRLLVEVAERVGAELEAAEAELAVRAERPGGVVRLLAFATALQTLVPRAAAALARSAPELRLEIDEADPDDALRLLAQQRADVVVAHDYDLLERRRPGRLHRRDLLADELLVVGADGGAHGAADAKRGTTDAKRGAADAKRGAKAAKRGTKGATAAKRGADGAIPLADLAARDWVLPDRDSACDRVVERACAAAGFAPRVIARSSDFAAIAALARATGSVALVPRLALPGAPSPRGDGAATRDGAPSPRGDGAATRDGAPSPRGDGAPTRDGDAASRGDRPARPLTTPVRRQLFAAVRDGAERRPLEAAVLDALAAAAR